MTDRDTALPSAGSDRSFAGAIRAGIPYASPVDPVELGLDSEIQFHCHKGVSCFNACCHSIDITLTPYDILRLKNRLGLDSRDFVARYTVPFELDGHGMPGLKMATKGGGECVFLTGEGCSVYADRPSTCRYYALGSMGVRRKGESTVSDIYFVVREAHCKGHEEPRRLTVRQYLDEQGIDVYERMNREWRDIVIKKRSSGPTVGRPTPRSMQLFDMCSYDLDSFREFIASDGFAEVFDLGEAGIEPSSMDDEALLAFACRFLKQVLFGETTIARRADARERRLEHLRYRRSGSHAAAADGEDEPSP